jgi:hypothetical protein
MPSGSNGFGSGSGLKSGGTVAAVMVSPPGSAGGEPGRNCRNRADSGPLAGCSSFGGSDSGAAVRSGGSVSDLARALWRATGSLSVALPRFSRRFGLAADLPGEEVACACWRRGCSWVGLRSGATQAAIGRVESGRSGATGRYGAQPPRLTKKHSVAFVIAPTRTKTRRLLRIAVERGCKQVRIGIAALRQGRLLTAHLPARENEGCGKRTGYQPACEQNTRAARHLESSARDPWRLPPMPVFPDKHP